MKIKSERLNKLDDRKLVDIVKNYRQYDYDEEVREQAIEILNARGLSEEDLKFSGNFDNTLYDEAEEAFISFNRNSKIVFALYVLLILTNVLEPMVNLTSDMAVTMAVVVEWVLIIAYLIYFIKSALNYNKFYEKTSREGLADSSAFYILLGMPLYLFLYFFFKSRMTKKMRQID